MERSLRNDGGKDIVDFIERVQQLADTFNIPIVINWFKHYLLRNHVLEWHRNNRHGWDNWSAFKEKAYSFFLPRNYKKLLTEEIQQRRQKPHETEKRLRWSRAATRLERDSKITNEVERRMIAQDRLFCSYCGTPETKTIDCRCHTKPPESVAHPRITPNPFSRPADQQPRTVVVDQNTEIGCYWSFWINFRNGSS